MKTRIFYFFYNATTEQTSTADEIGRDLTAKCT